MSPNTPSFDASRIRSLLFVPMLAERLIAKAPERGADAVILDLEDAVAPDAKDAARAALADTVDRLVAAGQRVLVRINNEPDLIADDITAANGAGLHGVVLPKAGEADSVAAIVARLAAPAVVPILETPLGVINAPAIAKAGARIAALAFGSEDFSLAMGIAPDEQGLAMPAQQIAMAARAAGKPAFGLPGSLAIIDDIDRFTEIARAGRAIGMTGALAIHPRQVAVLNAVFAPTAAEIEEARAIRSVYETAMAKGRGAVALGGRMIDLPVYRRALATLARAPDAEADGDHSG
ncbi:MAG: CoA ester lyase [Bauldia sp.]|uniref:HpcH/HpaI aldolase/citrate lyase family protein n=1 Tax=Bauldia sp. TaxID=2575872 RepID=UPI001DFE1367|nr:CoA ester lyase [Bauldia sp.]MCB1497643.1 CoA ester lyase [Bauldia sp.]